MIEYFPGTTDPVPILLTEEEAVCFLRLNSGGREIRLATRAFLRLVERKQIRPCRVGKRRRYLREELIRFLRRQTALLALPEELTSINDTFGVGSGNGLAPIQSSRYNSEQGNSQLE